MKVALVSTPSQVYSYPAPSIFFLKGCLNSFSINSRCFDLNFDFLNEFGSDSIGWCENNIGGREKYLEYIKNYSKRFAGYDWIAISVFTYNSQIFTRKLLEQIRTFSDAKIVLGGAGIESNLGADLGGSVQFFGQEMVEVGLADFVLRGEGDYSLANLISGGSNDLTGTVDMSKLPFPDYSDVDLSRYESKSVMITGSRGCVRNCTFCDVSYFWPGYRYRPGEEIFKEMKYVASDFGVSRFFFSDSLVNGALKEFKKMIKLLSDKNINFKWQGQFIFRSGMKLEDWRNLKASGCEKLWVGVESGSEKIRNLMKKNFNDSILKENICSIMEQNISLVIMLIVGFPHETTSDFEKTLELIEWLKSFEEKIEIRLSPAMILPNTELHNVSWYGEIDEWKFKNGEQVLGHKERLQRWRSIEKIVANSKLLGGERISRQIRELMSKSKGITHL